MSIMVLGAIIDLFVVVMALSGSRKAQRALIFISSLMAAGVLAIWFFLYR